MDRPRGNGAPGPDYFILIPRELRQLLMLFVDWTVLDPLCDITAFRTVCRGDRVWEELYRLNFTEYRRLPYDSGRAGYMEFVRGYYPISARTLSAAASHGHEKMVERAIEHGVDVNIDRGDPLTAASSIGRLDIVDRLVRAGANVHAGSADVGDRALTVASGRGHLAVVEYWCSTVPIFTGPTMPHFRMRQCMVNYR